MTEADLRAGIEAFKLGEIDKARFSLAAAIKSDPNSVEAWLWLGRCLSDLEQRRYCFKKALSLDPGNLEGAGELGRLGNQADFGSSPSNQISSIANKTGPSSPDAEPGPARSVPIEMAESPIKPAVDRLKPSRADKSEQKKEAQEWIASLVGFMVGILLCGIPLALMAFLGKLDQFTPGSTALIQKTQPGVTVLGTTPATPSQTPTRTTTPTASPTSTRKPPTFTPTLDPTEAYQSRRLQANQYINNAKSLMSQEKYADAIAYWDLAQALFPDNGEVYYQRGKCYLSLLENQRSFSEYSDYAHAALNDLDMAIAIGPATGDQYLDRARVYSKLAGLEDLTANSNYLYEISLENRQAAVKLGNSTPQSEYQIPYLLFDINRCKEGLAETQKLIDQNPARADKDPTLLNMQANGLTCLGKLDQALVYVDKTIKIRPDSTTDKWLRAVILYQLGRKTDALEQLDELIEDNPDYRGYRYYLRALIYYEQENPVQAREDMYKGAGNTWGHGGLYAYLEARFELDEGNREQAIESLQFAEASTPYIFNIIRERMRKELAKLGAQPLVPTPSVSITTTPLPPSLLVPPPTQGLTSASGLGTSVPTPSGMKVPQYAAYATVVDMENGSGPLTLHANDDPLFRFKPRAPLPVKFVQTLTFHIESSLKAGATTLQLYLWDPVGGGWRYIEVVWGNNSIRYPDDLVFRNGEIYVSLRNWGKETVEISNMGFNMIYDTTNGGASSYGLK